ncbi:MAG TPA: hypothetical protein VFD58_29065 [Blastocatellia bacterium]|nr:hypothetical protein [Blastocatellia bacterium]
MNSISQRRSARILTVTARVLMLLVATCTAAWAADPIVRQATGVIQSDIQPAINAFRTDLGGVNNGAGGPATGGRREITWDGVPDALSSPNGFPADFFNSTAPRGLVLSTPGGSLQVSAKLGNPTDTLVRFGNINSAYVNLFQAFSPERIFTAVGSTITDVNFYVPGTGTPALSKGFGVVFTDVSKPGSTKLEYWDAQGNLLFSGFVPAVQGVHPSFSFLGVSFDSPVVAWVRITTGSIFLAGTSVDTDTDDVAAMDDFIFGEPQGTTNFSCNAVCFASGDYWRLHLKPCSGFDDFKNNNISLRIAPVKEICPPSALIHLPGFNNETPVSIQGNIAQIKLLLNPTFFSDPPSPETIRETLIAEYIAAQLSLVQHPGALSTVKQAKLGCYGLRQPVTLGHDNEHLSAFSSIADLLNETKEAIKADDTSDMAKLLLVYEFLQGTCAK